MNVATAPSTPDNAKSPPIFRRAFTVPTRFSALPRAPVPLREAEAHGAETLFAHDSCKIVSFSTGFRRPSSSGSGYNGNLEDPVGTLPWASLTERTIAAGPLRIYRVLEVSFLNSGSTLRPILAKSQCWCVDGESKFVLKVGPDDFYRIELPNTCPEENKKVEKLKEVLPKVLRYEVTQCPFKRGFTVDLPKPPATPIRKRPWKPKRPSQPSLEQPLELDVDSSGSELRHNRGKGAALKPRGTETGESSQVESADEASLSSNASTATAPEDDADSSMATEAEDVLPALAPRDFAELDLMKTPTRPKSLKAGRAITAPPQLTLRTTPPSNPTSEIAIPPKCERESPSASSSMESFHSFHSPISPLPPSPLYSDPPSFSLITGEDSTLEVQRVRSHKRDISDVTLTTDTPHDWIMTPTHTAADAPPTPQTPPLTNDTSSQTSEPNPDPITPSPRTQLRRRRTSRQRAASPLPPPANLYSPRSSRLSGHHLTTAILQKTCSLLLGPPIQLVALMLNIARKIAQGTYCGFAFGHGDQGQRIPCSWDFSEDDEEEFERAGGGEGEEGWYEDDYGVSLRSVRAGREMGKRAKEVGGSWEID